MLYSRSARCCRTLSQRWLLSTKITPKGLPEESPGKSRRSPPPSHHHRYVRFTTSPAFQSPDTGLEDAVCLHRSTAVCPSTANPGNNAVQLFQHSQRISTKYCSVLYTDKETQLPPFLRSSDISRPSGSYKRMWRTSCQICYFTTFPLAKRILEAWLSLGPLLTLLQGMHSPLPPLTSSSTPKDTHSKSKDKSHRSPTLTCFPF